MRTFILPALVIGLICTGAVQAQVGSSISSDGTPPNTNAMLDVQSPSTGDGKGMLIPRITLTQRTNASADVAGGLLDNSGNLRGGAAQGLIVYQTDSDQGLYFNTSSTATPAWEYYLPCSGGTMSGTLNMGDQIITNVSLIDFSGAPVAVGRGANGAQEGAAVGYNAIGNLIGAAVGHSANGSFYGAAVGKWANGSDRGAAMGYSANGTNYGAALGYCADGSITGAAVGAASDGSKFGAAVGYLAFGALNGAAVGKSANGNSHGAAVGYYADGAQKGAAVGAYAKARDNGAAVGYEANGFSFGTALGYGANGYFTGAAVGYEANGTNYGAALGNLANGSDKGVAVGSDANGLHFGAALGYFTTGTNNGAVVGRGANGNNYGVAIGSYAAGGDRGIAIGRLANGNDYGVAMGYTANGARTNIAIGAYANAQGGPHQIAIGDHVTNIVNNSTCIRGTLYLDGGTGVNYRAGFGSGTWSNKAFTIDHPLDPENMVLRHFCMEGPDVWNVYAGNAQLKNGFAVVELPEYYSALNLVGSEVYSLTPIGQAQVWIESKTGNNQFLIGGDRDAEVSWTIKVLRNDPGCLEDILRRPVEQLKSEIR